MGGYTSILAGVVIAVIVIVAVLFFIVVYMISKKVFDIAVGVAPKDKVFESNAEDAGSQKNTAANDWLAAQPLIELRVAAADGLELFGRILPAPRQTRKWVILLHGFSGSGLKMGGYARHFHKAGFNVLLPDMRGCGNTGGKYMGLGWLDARDMLFWIDRILQITPDAKIVISGGSMGGACAMMCTGYPLKHVVAAVEDCGYSSVWDEYAYQLKKVFGLPAFPFMYVVDALTRKRAGFSFKEASSVGQLKKSRVPTLFIHGTEDEFVPSYMLEENYEAAACEKQKLAVTGAGHGLSSEVDPQLYWSTVDSFIARYMGDGADA
jgi:pimeloyl-ACP methyl ester carboxylesterase